jgi:8-oxo-dGTP pyrophosphatase MutT (NUDIX family)
VLLVRLPGHDDGWGVPGGAVDVGDPPAAAAAREAREETGADVGLVRLADVPGGPGYEVSYPGGDRTVYVSAVCEARIISGSPASGDGKLSELAWFNPGTAARPEAEPALPRHPPLHRAPMLHGAPLPPSSPQAAPIGPAERPECGRCGQSPQERRCINIRSVGGSSVGP